MRPHPNRSEVEQYRRQVTSALTVIVLLQFAILVAIFLGFAVFI